MKVLHIYRSEPSETTKKLVDALSEGNEVTEIKLYEGNVDYDDLVKKIFECDKVICW